MSPLWLTCVSFILSLAWLLPNHSLPWLSFHSDAWTALVLSLVAGFVLWQTKFASYSNTMFRAALATVAIPLFQYIFGLIPLFGVAWINAAYILGFLLALHVGANWSIARKNQCGDFIFLAICIAAVVSTGLQLHQFFHLEDIGPWILRSSYNGTRHFANMAQPNQLASLLLLGCIGCAWGYFRKLISGYLAVVIAALLMFGVVLTESRTGWLNIFVITAISLCWKKLFPNRTQLLSIIALALFFLVSVLSLSSLNEFFGGGLPVEYRATTSDPRWTAWRMFLNAAWLRPIFGFGWGQLAHAQFLMLDERIALGGTFLQAHNLVIDFILWSGIPIGLGMVAVLLRWFWRILTGIRDIFQLMEMSFLVVLGMHAMFEYPLQYAYFLLPTGLIMGSLSASCGIGVVNATKKWPVALMLIASISVLGITVRDYFLVEDSFYGLRFEQKKIDSYHSRKPPNVIALTQWRDYIIFARIEPSENMTPSEIDWMRNLVTTMPSAYAMYRLAMVLVLNDQPEEARQWLKRVCLTSPQEQCEVIKIEWEKQSTLNAKLVLVTWPSTVEK
jgi:hypothetical protein